jgi:hypothetical protein
MPDCATTLLALKEIALAIGGDEKGPAHGRPLPLPNGADDQPPMQVSAVFGVHTSSPV